MDGMDTSDGNFLQRHFRFLPIPTTPGDRLFIGLLGSGYIFLAWLALTDFTLWIMLAIAACWMIVVMRWG
jgi:predicted small integral membrane protein